MRLVIDDLPCTPTPDLIRHMERRMRVLMAFWGVWWIAIGVLLLFPESKLITPMPTFVKHAVWGWGAILGGVGFWVNHVAVSRWFLRLARTVLLGGIVWATVRATAVTTQTVIRAGDHDLSGVELVGYLFAVLLWVNVAVAQYLTLCRFEDGYRLARLLDRT